MTRKPASDWRTAHGTAAAGGALVVLETGRDRPLSPADSQAEADRSSRDGNGRFAPSNRIGCLPKNRAGPSGVLAKLEAKADPSWQASRRAGRRAAKHRVTEMGRVHGELSSAVCRLIHQSCVLAADAEYLRARAAADDNVDLLKIAATLDGGSRQAGRDAWELAVREAQARPQESARDRLVRQIEERKAREAKEAHK